MDPKYPQTAQQEDSVNNLAMYPVSSLDRSWQRRMSITTALLTVADYGTAHDDQLLSFNGRCVMLGVLWNHSREP